MFNVEFKKKFDCIICLDGEPPNAEIFKLLVNIPILAADGAAFYLDKIGLIPNKIIGDLDTFNKNSLKNKFSIEQLIHISEQETNDFEKVLKYAIKNSYSNCLILGINGGEFEHTLNNWSIFIRYAALLNLCALTKNRYSFLVDKSISLKLKNKEIVSLIPQPSVILTTRNLEWELENETLNLGKREGARNYTKKENIILDIHDGSLLLCIDDRLPYAPTFQNYNSI